MAQQFTLRPTPIRQGIPERVSLNLTDAPFYSAGQTAYNTGSGFWLGVDEGVAKLSIGDSAGDSMTWDGTTLTITGALTATTGAIGGFDIGTDYIRDAANSMGIASTVTGGDDVRFWAGDTFANRATADFRVTEAGALTATSAAITGGDLTVSTINDGAVTTVKIADGNVTTIKILDGNITEDKLATDSVTETKLGTGSVTTTKLGDTSVTEAKIGSASVTEEKIGTSAITTIKINDLAITTDKLAALGVTAAKIGAAAVEEAKLATGAVTADKIGTAAVTTAKINDAAITVAKHASGLRPVEIVASLGAAGTQGRTVFLTTDNKLYRDTGAAWTAVVPTTDLTGQITTTQITDDAVTTDKIAANTIVAGNIAAGTITTTEIAADTIVAGNIAAGAINTDQLAADAVTAAKIAAGTITTTEIAAGTILAGNIAAGAITSSELAAGAVIAGKITAGTIVAADIASGTITTTQIATDTILAGNIAAGAIGASELAAGSVIAGKIAAGTVVAADIAASTITGTEISSLSISGKTLTADTGTVGGWTMGANSLTSGSGTTTVGMDNTSTAADDVRIYAGGDTKETAPFRVHESGAVHASNMTITGGVVNASTIETSGFKCDSADFDGTNDYMTRGAGLTGAADSKSGIFSCWLRLDGGDDAKQKILHGFSSAFIQEFQVVRWDDNKIYITGTNSTGAQILSINGNTARLAGATWLHILASWDLADPGSAGLYINDVSDLVETTFTDANLDYTLDDWRIAARLTSAAEKLNGCLAEVYFAPGQYLDFSDEANRRKFITVGGQPVDLGSDGSTPTGTAPLVYEHLDVDEAVANFATNAGTGGDFTITGTLETGSTSPAEAFTITGDLNVTGSITSNGSMLTSGSVIATTSGTSHDFENIPTWVKRITIQFSGVSTNGSTALLVRLGRDGVFEATGYVSAAGAISTAGTGTHVATTIGLLATQSMSASLVHSGIMDIALLDSSIDLWAMKCTMSTTGAMYVSSGHKALANVLDGVRITTVNGTDTFDAGSINILYE